LQYREDIPTPEPETGEVLIRVQYAALNRLDDFVRTGWRGLKLAFPHILGSDLSGTIATLGSGVTGWQIGQRVVANPTLWCGHCAFCIAGRQNQCEHFAILGEHVPGAYAEYVRVPAKNLVAVPEGFPPAQAAAMPLVGVTAWHMLVIRGNLKAGETVLIVGSGGGVNSAAIQIAKLAGATVLVVAGNATKAENARELGADWTVDREQSPDWGKAVWEQTGRQGVNIVVDNVGETTWTASLRSLARGGRLLTVGGTTGYNGPTPINLLFGRHLSIIGSTMGTQADFEAVMTQVWAGRLRPIVDEVFPLAQYPQALQHMLGGQGFGKILLSI
jgi:NADPH:quinone reductase-like Zn-dependent oxidoreductase